MFDVTKFAVQEAIIDLGSAFRAFFEKRGRYPRFKKKGIRDSFCAANEIGRFRVEDRRIKLPGIGWVRMREAVRFSGRLKRVTVSREADRWFASIMVETDDIRPTKQAHDAVGVDLGVTTLATLSTAEEIAGPKAHKVLLKRLRRASRALSRGRSVVPVTPPVPAGVWRGCTPASPISGGTPPTRPQRCWRRPIAASGSRI